ncbi:MAG: hypothetical protein WA269_15650 [Candidatus Udaeobacter sp.]
MRRGIQSHARNASIQEGGKTKREDGPMSLVRSCNADQTYFALTLLERRLGLNAGQVMASYRSTSRAIAGTQTMGAKPVDLLPGGVADALEIHGPIFVAEVPPM